MELPFSNHERVLRFAVSVLCTRPEKAGDSPDVLAEQIESHAPGLGPVGGSALYDLACLRIAIALRQKDLARAQQAVDWGLEQTCTALFPTTPDCFWSRRPEPHRRRHGQTGVGRPDAPRHDRGQPHGEGLGQPAGSGLPVRARRGGHPQTRSAQRPFLFEWLQRSAEIAQAPATERAKLASSIYDRDCSPAERLLGQGLARYYLP